MATDATDEIATYTPHAGQQRFHADPAKYRLLLGAWRSGKSYAGIWEMIMLGIEHAGARIGIFRKFYPSLRDSTKLDFLAALPRPLVTAEVKSEGREHVEIQGGSQYWFRSLDDWRKLGSYSFDAIFLDEAYEATEADFNMLSKGRLSGRIGPRRMVLSSNPPNIDHWLYQRFVVQAQPNMTVHHFSTYDNRDHLDPDYLAELEEMPESWKRKFLHGLWGFLAEGEPVYNEFHEPMHVAAIQPARAMPIMRGWDFGFRHPAVSFVQILPTGHVNVLYELFGTNEDLPSFVTRVQQETKQHFFGCTFEDYCDIAGTQHDQIVARTSVSILHDHDVYPMFRRIPLVKSIESVRYLIRTLAGGRPLLQVDTGCRLTIEAFSGGYMMDPKTDKPKKDGAIYEHLMDAFRMAVAPVAMPMHADWVGHGVIREPRYAL